MHLKTGNKKLALNVATFSLPAGKKGTCALDCKGCYAMKGTFLYKNVKNSFETNYAASKQDNFSDIIVAETTLLKLKGIEFVRVHVAGDFYSQSYINKWVEIATRQPDLIFYAYTKRLEEFNFSKLKALKNFVLIDSLHFNTINYGDTRHIEALSKKHPGAIVCEYGEKPTACGTICKKCMTKDAETNGVLFIKH